MWNRVLENVFRKADHIGSSMVGNRPSDVFAYKDGYYRERGKRRLAGLLLMALMMIVVIAVWVLRG